MFKVCNLLREKLEMKVTMADIDIAHRLGPVRQPVGKQKPKPSPIIVKFMSKVLKAKIYIREDLTQYNQTLLENVQYDGRVQYAYPKEGQIYTKLCDMDYPRQIKCLEDNNRIHCISKQQTNGHSRWRWKYCTRGK